MTEETRSETTELIACAQINFENLEKAFPMVRSHAYYSVAKHQLDEAVWILTGRKPEKPVIEKPKTKHAD